MSVTTSSTTIVRPATVMQALGDYELHHSGGPGSAESRVPPPNPRQDLSAPSARENPAGWPTEYRDVPNYRPIDYNLDTSQRPAGENLPVQIFIWTLLNGVGVNAVSCSS